MSRRSFFIVSSVPVLTAADTWDTFCRTVGFLRYLGYVLSYRWLGLGLTNRYLDNDNNDESHPNGGHPYGLILGFLGLGGHQRRIPAFSEHFQHSHSRCWTVPVKIDFVLLRKIESQKTKNPAFSE